MKERTVSISRDVIGSLALGIVAAVSSVVGCSGSAETDAQSVAHLSGSPHYVVDVSQTSVSGLSSGGFMAVQFHVAYSSIMKGAAVFAGGPFFCAQGSEATAVTTCMSSSSKMDVSPYVATTKSYAAAGYVDPTSNLTHQNVFLFGGADDDTVNPAVMDGLSGYYQAFVTGGTLTYESHHPKTAHTMPTVDYGGDCDKTAAPYIGKCNYDGAGQALAAIYGPLQSPASTLGGTFVTLSQGDFITDPASHGLADTAYAYVPQSCASGEACRIHVAFHGCLQYASGSTGSAFYQNAGYNPWADTNHIIVLYPQTVAKSGSNPNGCWDWWGYDSPDYAKKTGPQMAMVKAMIDSLAGAPGGMPDAGPVGQPLDAGLGDGGSEASDGAIDGSSVPEAGPGDAQVDASPISTDASVGTCILASTADHVAAGRAWASFGWAYAAGSNELLGLISTAVQVPLQQLAPGIYAIGFCRP